MKTLYGLVAGLTCLYAWAGCDSSTTARTAGWEVTEEIASPPPPRRRHDDFASHCNCPPGLHGHAGRALGLVAGD